MGFKRAAACLALFSSVAPFAAADIPDRPPAEIRIAVTGLDVPESIRNSPRLLAGDINGDRRDELVIPGSAEGTLDIAFFGPNSVAVGTWAAGWPADSLEMQALARIDADACSDLLLADKNWNWFLSRSDCRSGFGVPEALSLPALAFGAAADASDGEAALALWDERHNQAVIFGLSAGAAPVHRERAAFVSPRGNFFHLGAIGSGKQLAAFVSNRGTSRQNESQINLIISDKFGLPSVRRWAEFVGGFAYSGFVALQLPPFEARVILAQLVEGRRFFAAIPYGVATIEISVEVPEQLSAARVLLPLDADGDGDSELLLLPADRLSASLAQISVQLTQLPQPDLHEHRPRVCNGYNIGASQRWGRVHELCPAGHAVYGAMDISRSNTIPTNGAFSFTCCPLPAADILTDEHVWVDWSCPENFVFTGLNTVDRILQTPNAMRCTRLNTGRYRLGEARKAQYWGIGTSLRTSHLIEDRLPPGIAHGLKRHNSSITPASDGCVGLPFASLLTAYGMTRGCGDFVFRRLEYAGTGSEPEAGSAVKMYPDCARVENLLTPFPTCVR